jgi:hypothetical protein
MAQKYTRGICYFPQRFHHTAATARREFFAKRHRRIPKRQRGGATWLCAGWISSTTCCVYARTHHSSHDRFAVPHKHTPHMRGGCSMSSQHWTSSDSADVDARGAIISEWKHQIAVHSAESFLITTFGEQRRLSSSLSFGISIQKRCRARGPVRQSYGCRNAAGFLHNYGEGWASA